MSSNLRIVMAQVNPLVGDIPGNTRLVLEAAEKALSDYQANIVVFPELVLTAYPPEDLLLRPSLDHRIEGALEEIKGSQLPIHIVVGYPGREEGELFNMLSVIFQGDELCRYKKQCLPNYQVFDEKRYFKPGNKISCQDIAGRKVAFTICEDMWEEEPMQQAVDSAAELMININGSPFHVNKQAQREELVSERARAGNMPVIYVNQVGAQDELVFDGGSVAVNADGNTCVRAPLFEETLEVVDVSFSDTGTAVKSDNQSGEQLAPIDDQERSVYHALVLGIRDYVNKNGFPGVVLGLSGGIDSALTLAICVDALGRDRVHAVMMPYKYTAQMSLDDAEQEAVKLGIDYRVIPIAPIYESFLSSLEGEFAGTETDMSEQNLQARCRGVLLMAISNKKGLLVVTTGNKSEMAVGYSTLYGDMAGGFDVLKDVPKMLVYQLARFRNERYGERSEEIIPQRVIDRPPSAELAPDQVDEDNLPPYEVLDKILELYIEQDMSFHKIVDQGFPEETVALVIRLVDVNEHKRRQAPVGVRISQKGFGRDRRYPITSGWKPGL